MNRKNFNIMLCLLFLPYALFGQVSIRLDSVARSNAEIGAGYEAGGFRRGDDAESLWKFGAQAATTQILEKMTLAGDFSYAQTEFSGMCGSMFIHPGFYPIDVYEFTPGRKTLQSYSMDGGLSVDLGRHWCLGGEFSYLSENIAKRKDLRHSNYRLDMSVEPGLMYRNGVFAAAISLIWSRNTETVEAEQIGNNTSGYEAFFSKGVYYGVGQMWTGSEIHLTDAGTSGLPLSENLYGVGAEVFWKNLSGVVKWRKRDGLAGERQTIWYRFPGWDISADASWNFRCRSLAHKLSASFYMLDQTNNETVLDKETEGGITLTHEYGSNFLSRRRNIVSSLSYRCEGSSWAAGLVMSYLQRDWRIALMYPYLIKNTYRRPSVEINGEKKLGSFNFALSLGGGMGFMSDSMRKVNRRSGINDEPQRLLSSYSKYEEYCTRTTLNVAPSIKYDLRHGIYIEADGMWLHGFGVETLGGADRFSAGLKFGYNF